MSERSEARPSPARARLVRLAGACAAVAPTLLWASLALAVEADPNLHEEVHHGPSWTLTLLGFVNFALYAYIMWRFAWPPLVRYLKERRAGVVEALAAAATARAEAEAMRADFEAKLRNVEADAERAREELMAIARIEAAQIVEQAQRSADRIRRDAKLVADQEVARARRQLQEEAARLIASIAAGLVAKQLTGDDQVRFIKDFIAEAKSDARSSGNGRLSGVSP